MSFGTVLSRVTGLLRLAAIVAALGVVESGRLADTYNLANTAPLIIYELILGGILTSVFVPVFVELLEKEGRERAWQVASALINLSLVVLAAIVTLGIAAAPWIAQLYAFRLGGEVAELQRETLSFLLRLFFPQIIFFALTAITSGLLNAHRRFGPPMYTPILNNLAVIAVFLTFRATYGRVQGLADVTTPQLLLIGLGTTGGVVLMALAQLPFLRGLGRYRPVLSFRHPALRKVARLSVFVIGYVIANQIGYLIVQILANGQRGGYTAYVGAFTFFMLPHGLFAVSVITALLPRMSENAVKARWDLFRDSLSTGMRATLLLILPAAVGYLVLAEPIIRLLLENGVMTARSTDLVAGVLRVFVLGLIPFSMFQLFLRSFYALQDTRTPFLINAAGMGVNIAANLTLFALIGVRGLAAGHAIAYWFGSLVQARTLSRRVGGMPWRPIARSTARISLAAAGMGGAVWAAHRASAAAIGARGIAAQVAVVVIPVTVGVLVYLALAVLLRVEELSFLRRMLGRRLDAGNTHSSAGSADN